MITRVKVESSTGKKLFCERLTHVYLDTNITAFWKMLAECNWDKIYESIDVTAAYDKFSYVINSAYDVAFLLIIRDAVKEYKKEWFTAELFACSKKRL